MATRRPVAPDASGTLTQIVAPDTIDASILPASSGTVPVTVSTNYSIAANTQAFARFMKIDASHDVLIPADSELVFA